MNYIINFNPININDSNVIYYAEIENKIINKESLSQKEVNDFLDVISYIVRSKINPNLDNYDNKCDLAISILYHYLKKLNCSAFSAVTQKSITNSIVGHNFLTLQLFVDGKIKNYLIDPTYIQFFKKDKCTIDNYYISPMYKDIVLLTPDPGFFIKEEMKEHCTFLLNHGYIELTEENARMYGDSFYNTKTGVSYSNKTYQTIPGSVYINAFMKGSQPVSKTEEELEKVNLNIKLFKEQLETIKKR